MYSGSSWNSESSQSIVGQFKSSRYNANYVKIDQVDHKNTQANRGAGLDQLGAICGA